MRRQRTTVNPKKDRHASFLTEAGRKRRAALALQRKLRGQEIPRGQEQRIIDEIERLKRGTRFALTGAELNRRKK